MAYQCFNTVFVFYSCQPAEKEEAAEEKKSEITFTSSSDEALGTFMEGLALFDMGGSGQKARAHFNAAIEKDNNFMAAYLYRAMTSGSAAEFAADLDKAGELMEGKSEVALVKAKAQKAQKPLNPAKKDDGQTKT